MRNPYWLSLPLSVVVSLLAGTASAQPAPSPPAAVPAPAISAPPAQESPPVPAVAQVPPPAPVAPSVKLDGYVEASYSRNFNEPSNGITNYRGFDNRHDTFSLSNAVLGATLDYESLSARVALQVGETPSTYYLGEPSLAGSGATPKSDAEVWKYIQQAYAGWKAPVGRGLLIQAGIFLSPIGMEGIAVKDNWNWSRSNLFFGLPFYHTGLKVSYDFTDRLSGMLLVSNGWNNVTDSNDWKSISAQAIYKVPDRLTVSALYFGGPERPKGSPEGQPWRHLFDLWAQLDATPELSFAAHGDVGFERNDFGLSYWGTAALYARVRPVKWLYVAARGDSFWEHAAENALGTAGRLFWPADNVTSGTATIDVRPHSNVSFRLEYRHDQATGPMFFAGEVQGDGTTTPYVPNAQAQDTLTAGVTGWL